ncbi:MAG TPA: 2OG-Fe(II) oxygenase [Allosphingosinicella sp.]|jgi:Rps23 Pro-64 3,4-dihydroxylase Tpa1-like proline 4-hydroxylase
MAAIPPRPLPPCHQYRDFLDPGEHQALLEWAIAGRERFKPARLTGHVLDPERRIAERLNDLGPHRPMFERRLNAILPDIFRRAGTKPFDIEYFELEVAAHGDGAFFMHHSDIPVGKGRKPLGGDESGKQDRLISAVYYFHREPKRFSGGKLRLYRLGDHDASGDFVEFEPEQNSLVVFPSWVRHEVIRVSCPECRFEDYRFAVNAWLCRTLPPRPPLGED